ncbi:MAG: tRNA pseudouridine(55) synthase TruB [Elusimicrobia bacterium]|nr:MAG: tRNA pseudouridine(55) synthase TruB [Elusimicrobiota bacterium]
MNLDGVLLVDKAKDWTSHDAVAVTRRLFDRGTKVGHAGTLDPAATGLLVLLIGRATRTAESMLKLPKVYSGTVRLGIETETEDLEGKVVREEKVPELSAEDLQALFDRFHGDVEMPVPKYSAVKFKGKARYKYARGGIAIPEARRVSRIDSWKLTAWNSPEVSFTVTCGSGTYVRSLASLVGRELGCGGALSALRREQIGEYRVEEAVSVDSLKDLEKSDDALKFISDRLLPAHV